MSTRKRIEHAVARAASRHIAPQHIDAAIGALAAKLRDPKIAPTLDALSAPHGAYVDKVEEIARGFFEQHAKQNPGVARELPPVDVAASAKKAGLDWNG